MKLKDLSIDGRTFAIEVRDDGWFRSIDAGSEVKAATLEDLTDKLRARVRRTKVRLALPITLLGVTQAPDPDRNRWMKDSAIRAMDGEVVDATVTGLHAQNDDLLVDLPDGTKHRMAIRGYRHAGDIARRLTSAEVAEYKRLALTMVQAKDAFEAFVKSVEIDSARQWVKTKVEEAEKAALDAEPVVEDEAGDPRVAAPRRGKK